MKSGGMVRRWSRAADRNRSPIGLAANAGAMEVFRLRA